MLFHDTHPFAECVGPALAKAHQELPDLLLFAEPGGRIVLHDPKQWGYHAHLPGGVLRIPAGKPGLTIALPRDEAALPDSISFVSPAQEIRAGDGEGRSSYAIPDAVTVGVKPLSAAGTLLPLVKKKMGKSRQQLLGTMVQMGLQRVVVDQGQLHASMDMRVDTSSVSTENKAEQNDYRVNAGASAATTKTGLGLKMGAGSKMQRV